MFSNRIKNALEAEVVGQRRAVNGIVRGVTRLVSGMTPRERSLCAYLFMGPTGTGKSHLIQSVARILHGHDRFTVTVDCSQFAHADPWVSFLARVAPLFAAPEPHQGPLADHDPPPLTVIHVDFLERAPKPFFTALGSALESGQITLADGSRGNLRNCLVMMTSGLCSSEILDQAPRIGFTGAALDEEESEEEERIYRVCHEQAVEHFGGDLVGRLDGFIIFHRLQEEHIGEILDRRVGRLNGWLAARGLECEMLPKAHSFLLEVGCRDLTLGARGLVRAHQKFVEFPLADLLVSRRIPPGGRVLIDRNADEDGLHFTVEAKSQDASVRSSSPEIQEIPIG